MKGIWNWLAGLERDKVLHFGICLAVSMLTGISVKILGGDMSDVVAGSWFTGFLAGVAKEIYDEWRYKGADEMDWLADLFGTTAGTLLIVLIISIV